MKSFFLQKSPRKKSSGGGGGPFDNFDNSDESETSSLCSEKSFDYGRGRPSDVSIQQPSFNKEKSGPNLRYLKL